MTNWKAVVGAIVRAEGRWFTETVDLLTNRNKGWQDIPVELLQRSEAIQRQMFDDWRQAGVEQPINLYAGVSIGTFAFFAAGMWVAPGPFLSLQRKVFTLGFLYGTVNYFARREQFGRSQPRLSSSTNGTGVPADAAPRETPGS